MTNKYAASNVRSDIKSSRYENPLTEIFSLYKVLVLLLLNNFFSLLVTQSQIIGIHWQAYSHGIKKVVK